MILYSTRESASVKTDSNCRKKAPRMRCKIHFEAAHLAVNYSPLPPSSIPLLTCLFVFTSLRCEGKRQLRKRSWAQKAGAAKAVGIRTKLLYSEITADIRSLSPCQPGCLQGSVFKETFSISSEIVAFSAQRTLFCVQIAAFVWTTHPFICSRGAILLISGCKILEGKGRVPCLALHPFL